MAISNSYVKLPEGTPFFAEVDGSHVSMNFPLRSVECTDEAIIRWMGQQNPNHQLIDGKCPIIYRVSSILLVAQDFLKIHQ